MRGMCLRFVLIGGKFLGWVLRLAINHGMWRDKDLGICIDGDLDLLDLEKELAVWAENRYRTR